MEDNINRFIDANNRNYEFALNEIKAGKKKSHWMWYIFPQLKGLGSSEKALYYGISDVDEAKVYLLHPVLGQRLNEISHELLLLNENDAFKIFGSPDHLKLKSSMTLFSLVDDSVEKIFLQVLDKFFSGEKCTETLKLSVV